ncbi:MAG: tRNA (cytidine(34)-2'-O)-methyltransferase [Hyphomicrobiaceae bacterium]
MRLSIYQPDIPQNTGTILRMSACLGVPVDVIGPAGFDLSDRALRRSAMDYLALTDLTRHLSWDHFRERMIQEGRRIVLLTTAADTSYTAFDFRDSDCLLLGRESAGVPDSVHRQVDASVKIQMQPGLRSLNIAVAAAMVLGEGLRQTRW